MPGDREQSTEPGSTFDVRAIDTDGDGRPDTIIETSARGLDLDGDGRNEAAVIHSTSLTDMDGDGTPDIIERQTTVITDLDGDGLLDTTVVVERKVLDPAGVARANARTAARQKPHPLGITGIQHVSLNVDDNAAAVEFYVDVLGLEIIDRPDIGIAGTWLQAPNGVQIHLIELPGGGADSNHFALEVADIDAAIAGVRAKGVDAPDWGDIGTGRQVFLRDPSGNIVELNQP